MCIRDRLREENKCPKTLTITLWTLAKPGIILICLLCGLILYLHEIIAFLIVKQFFVFVIPLCIEMHTLYSRLFLNPYYSQLVRKTLET